MMIKVIVIDVSSVRRHRFQLIRLSENNWTERANIVLSLSHWPQKDGLLTNRLKPHDNMVRILYYCNATYIIIVWDMSMYFYEGGLIFGFKNIWQIHIFENDLLININLLILIYSLYTLHFEKKTCFLNEKYIFFID